VTLGIAIVFATGMHAQGNQTTKRSLVDHKDVRESRLAVTLFPIGMNESL